MRSGASVTVAAMSALAAALAVAETPAPPTPVIQVGVDVIRIDATVTDKSGRPVTDLRPEDFRLKVDGKRVPVENVAFFGEADATDGAAAAGRADAASGVETSIVFLIDDLQLSFSSVWRARTALEEFASGWDRGQAMIGLRFTSDESDTVLLSRNPARFDAGLERFRYNPRSGNPYYFGQRIYSLLTTINALRAAPGRKAVVLVTDGLFIQNCPDSRDQLGIESLFDPLFADRNTDAASRMITEVANRASTVVHTVHPQGLRAPWPGESTDFALLQMEIRGALAALAEDTGGLAIFNRNNLRRGLAQIVKDQRSYYLVGFEPPESAFARSRRPKFHKIKLSVDRPGVRVRTRAGFYGVTDDEVLERAPISVAMTPEPLPMR